MHFTCSMNIFHLCVRVCLVASVMFDSVQPYRLQPARLLCLWDFPGKNTGVDCHAFLQGILLTQGLNPCLLLSRIADGFFTHWATWKGIFLLSVQFSSVQFSAQSCLTLCNPMDCNTPGLPVHHQLLELAQTHIHQVGHAIQASHPLLSLSLPAFNFSQQQGLF